MMLLNGLLLAGLAAVVWQGSVRWSEAQAARDATLHARVKALPPPPITPAPKPEPVAAAKYAEVADKNLFSKDRNATIVVEAPKVEAPKPMPPLPVVYGVMGLPSGTKAIMSEKAGAPSTTIRAGDTIGEFKIAALDPQNVTFDWNGKQIERRIDDLIDRSNTQAPQGGQPAAAPAAGAAAPPPPQAVNNNPTSRDVGVTLSATARACIPGDTSPPGAVVDGYKKVVSQSIFGTVCRWVKQ
jgi:hypothetical protein